MKTSDKDNSALNTKSYDFENLVLEGGGIKGLAYCGCIMELEKMKILSNIKRFAGSSAGAITAMLLAIGYNSGEICDIIKKTNFESFLDDKIGFIRDLYTFFTKYGVCHGDTFSNLIKSLIKKRTGNENYTFQNLYDDRKVELVITGTNLTNMESIYYSHHKYPNMSIHIAVRISMSIPFLFVPVRYDNKLLVDGGIIDNYPIHIFDGKYPGDPDAKMQVCTPNLKTLGLKLLTPSENTTWKINESVNNISSIKKMASSLANTLMLSNEQKYVNPINWSRTIPIKVPNYPLSKFKLSEQEQKDLITCGFDAIQKFFNAK